MITRVHAQQKLAIIAAVGLWLIAAFFGLQSLYSHRALALPDEGWVTVFSDEFNNTTLNSEKWVTCYDWYNPQYNGCTNEGNNESQWYLPQQVTVQNGYALLTAKRQDTLGWFKTYEQTYPYRSGMIATGRAPGATVPKWSGSYGYFEARMKVSSGTAVWPAFWLLPADQSWPPEIDVMELLGQKPREILMTYHWPGPEGQPAKDSTIYTGQDFTKKWHTYAVNWQPGQIDWYIDGKLRKTARGVNVPSKDMIIIFNLAIGGNLPGWPDRTTPDTSQVLIDYVRVKQPAAP